MLTIVIMTTAVLLPAHPPEAQVGCWCDKVKQTNGWCQQCKVGYIAGVKIESFAFVDALDTHGHTADMTALPCKSCREAAVAHSICGRCGWGFAKNRMYTSRLTYYLAIGQPRDRAHLTCEVCRSRSSASGWCVPCKTGWVGHFAYEDQRIHAAAAAEYAAMLRALETIDRCDLCPAAFYYGTTCPKCKTRYPERHSGTRAPGTSKQADVGADKP